MTTEYFPTIGLEIHAELKTSSKMFCSCKNDPDEEKPNTNICPICMGHPGTLPTLNVEAIKHVLRVGIAIDATLADFTEWDRKNYFYPDIPKGYQISQFKYPLVSGGSLAGVDIERVHLEEDTAQSTHDTHENSLVNFNRAGVPLLELVTKPVIHDAATAVNFAKELQLLLRCIGAGDANMEKGEMRVEANISVSTKKPDGNLASLGTKTEVKNLNSFKVVEKAIAYEIERQTSLLESGDKVIQETRGWDENLGETYSQRKKEGSHDYRYFPEPDIPKLKISEIKEFSVDALKRDIPELPWNKRTRYKKDYAMTDKEASMFVDSPALSKYFESIIDTFKTDSKKVKLSVNYLLSDYLGMLKKIVPANAPMNASTDASIDQTNSSNSNTLHGLETISPSSFAELISMIALGKISSRGAKELLMALIDSRGNMPENVSKLAEKMGLIQQSNASDLIPAIEKIIADNSAVVAEYKAGKTASLQFLIGQAMKVTRGSANPEVVKKMLIEKLG